MLPASTKGGQAGFGLPHRMEHRNLSVGRHARRRLAVVGVGVGLLGLLLGACGGSAASSSNTEVAGQLSQSELSGSGGHGAASTIPLAKQNTITALFTALSTFQSCLKGLGVTFIGIPDASNPNSPTNNPAYLKSLETCAAQSQILQALNAAQSAQNSLTLAQIHTENKEYLKWRTCMIGKGWTIPKPTPNAKGLLFSFGGAGGAGAGVGTGSTGSGGSSLGGIVPPPGQNLLSSGDLEACASQAIG